MSFATILSFNTESIATLADAIKSGDIVAIPTETVYGLAGDATSDQAVAKIFAAKKRPARNPLIVHYPSLDAASLDVVFNDKAKALANAFWPGPLTLVLPQSELCRISFLATSGLSTLAVRVPNHPAARALLQACGRPLAAPSANRSGQLSPVCAVQVKNSLGDSIHFILDGGACEEGIESTIVDVTGEIPVILRTGTITQVMLEAVVGKVRTWQASDNSHEAPKAPGMMFRHYAPSCPLRLSTDNPIPHEALIAFGEGPIPHGFTHVFNLSQRGDLAEAAKHLFDYLYQCEQLGASRIAVMPIPNEGIGIAINERLKKAAETA